MTLSQAILPAQSLVTRLQMVIGGSLFIAVSAQASVPMIPVPMTLQTLAILIVGLTFGARMGALTVAAYVAEGAMGLPVFANGGFGVGGPTSGFIIGFIGMAWLAGLAADRGIRSFLPLAAVTLAVSALLYVPGVIWLDVALGDKLDLAGSVKAGMLPFLLGDAVKSLIAALVVTGGWAALASRSKG